METPGLLVTGFVVTPSGVGGNCAVASEASAKLLAHSCCDFILSICECGLTRIHSTSSVLLTEKYYNCGLLVRTVEAKTIRNAENDIELACDHLAICSLALAPQRKGSRGR